MSVRRDSAATSPHLAPRPRGSIGQEDVRAGRRLVDFAPATSPPRRRPDGPSWGEVAPHLTCGYGTRYDLAALRPDLAGGEVN